MPFKKVMQLLYSSNSDLKTSRTPLITSSSIPVRRINSSSLNSRTALAVSQPIDFNKSITLASISSENYSKSTSSSVSISTSVSLKTSISYPVNLPANLIL